MKRSLWLLPAALAAVLWLLWLIFLVAALPEGPAEPREASGWRTLYFVGAIAFTWLAAALKARKA